MNLDEHANTIGADPSDVRTLEAVLTRIEGGLIVVRSENAGLAFDAALAVAQADTSEQYRAFDVHRAAPEGATWTVGEVEALIVDPATIRPYSRAHVVVADADQMAPAAWDRLLKVVEEPASDVVFWFCVEASSRLPATLVGRAAAVLDVAPTPSEQRIPALVEAGASTDEAPRILELCGPDVRLALAVARHGKLAELETASTTPLINDRPTRAADEVTAALMALATALVARGAPRKAAAKSPAKTVRPKWSDLTPAARTEGRRLIRTLLSTRTTAARRALSPTADPRTVQAAAQCLQALEAARAELATNASPTTVLPALWNRCRRY